MTVESAILLSALLSGSICTVGTALIAGRESDKRVRKIRRAVKMALADGRDQTRAGARS
jgi:hypothetical protein